jgi:lysophospholipase L1-like esterase
MSKRRIVLGAFALVVALATVPSGASRSGGYPASIAVLGHSGATGYNSDPRHPGQDASQNSWATGTNPAVDSIYRRILARNPAIRGHGYDFAVSGSDVNDLLRQAREAVSLPAKPGLVLIQTVDNDLKCDGTDAQNYAPYATKLAKVITFLAKRAPKARVFIVSVWATEQNYADAVQHLSDTGRSDKEGTGLCDVLDLSGKPRPAGIAAAEKIILAYQRKIAVTCARFATCRYDRGAVHRMVIQTADLTPDGNHLSVRGQRKMAAAAWAALY